MGVGGGASRPDAHTSVGARADAPRKCPVPRTVVVCDGQAVGDLRWRLARRPHRSLSLRASTAPMAGTAGTPIPVGQAFGRLAVSPRACTSVDLIASTIDGRTRVASPVAAGNTCRGRHCCRRRRHGDGQRQASRLPDAIRCGGTIARNGIKFLGHPAMKRKGWHDKALRTIHGFLRQC